MIHKPSRSETADRPDVALRLRTEIQPRQGDIPAVFAHLYASVERHGERMPSGRATVLGVTSAVGGEGKTTVALHLARNAARDSFGSVCLIDLGLGESGLCRRLGVSAPGEGVIDLLENVDGPAPELPLVQLLGADALILMPAGKAAANPARTARSPRMAELIAAARRMFDVVIVDLPPVESGNAIPITAHLDGVLMVVCAGATPGHRVNRALDQIGRERVLGVVLNRMTSSLPARLRKMLGGS